MGHAREKKKKKTRFDWNLTLDKNLQDGDEGGENVTYFNALKSAFAFYKLCLEYFNAD